MASGHPSRWRGPQEIGHQFFGIGLRHAKLIAHMRASLFLSSIVVTGAVLGVWTSPELPNTAQNH